MYALVAVSMISRPLELLLLNHLGYWYRSSARSGTSCASPTRFWCRSSTASDVPPAGAAGEDDSHDEQKPPLPPDSQVDDHPLLPLATGDTHDEQQPPKPLSRQHESVPFTDPPPKRLLLSNLGRCQSAYVSLALVGCYSLVHCFYDRMSFL